MDLSNNWRMPADNQKPAGDRSGGLLVGSGVVPGNYQCGQFGLLFGRVGGPYVELLTIAGGPVVVLIVVNR